MRVNSLLAAGICFLLGACGIPRRGVVYALPSGDRGQVVFTDSAGNRGEVSATLADGEHCRGRYATIPGPLVTWDDQETDTIYEEDTQDGMAVLDCNNGHLLRCNLARDIVGAGSGTCTDNRGQKLTMQF